MPVHAHFKGRRSLGIASVLEISPQRAHHLIRADRRFFYVKPPLPTGRLEMYTNRDRRRGDHGSEPKEKVDVDRVDQDQKDDDRPLIMHPRDKYISEFARELGGILKENGFYQFHGRAVQVRLVTVKTRNGKENKVKQLVQLEVPQF